MKFRLSLAVVFGLALCAAVFAQDQNSAGDQDSAPQTAQAGGYGRRGGRGFGGMGMMGRGVGGTVTEAAADHFVVKSFEGDTYTVNFGDNTRIVKMQGGMGMRRGGGGGMGERRGGGGGATPIKATDIKVGDAIVARGEVNSSAKTVGAVAIMQLDPQMAQRMQQMAADYGKTWLMGRVTSIDGTKVTLMGSQDNAEHTFVVNENTDFRERRNPITLADIKTGDMVRAEGALSGDTFTASMVNVMRASQGGAPGGPGGPPNP
jgi:hypothetical protein